MKYWIIFGFIGQICFGARFFVQWIVSEKKRKSIIPISFWYLSLIGGALLLAYAIHIKDIVFITGQSLGVFIYVRNLYLIKHKKRTENISVWSRRAVPLIKKRYQDAGNISNFTTSTGFRPFCGISLWIKIWRCLIMVAAQDLCLRDFGGILTPFMEST